MDFFVREVRAVVDGPLAIVRLGSCGSIRTPPMVGKMIVPNGAFAVTRNYNYFSNAGEASSEEKPYHFTKVFDADPELCEKIESQLLKSFGENEICKGLNATCDSFYSSQGRYDENFRDHNSDLISTILATYPNTVSLEMETFMLYHLAKTSTSAPLKGSNKDSNSIKAAATMMVFADRITNEFISSDKVQSLQEIAGKAVLNALAEIELNEVHPNNEECVWNNEAITESFTKKRKRVVKAASKPAPAKRHSTRATRGG